jgi:hypothetical protein
MQQRHIRMTLPGLSERAAADNRKCCAIGDTSIKRTYTNTIKIAQPVKRGGCCYMMADFPQPRLTVCSLISDYCGPWTSLMSHVSMARLHRYWDGSDAPYKPWQEMPSCD